MTNTTERERKALERLNASFGLNGSCLPVNYPSERASLARMAAALEAIADHLKESN